MSDLQEATSRPKRAIVIGGGAGLCDRLRIRGVRFTLVDLPRRFDIQVARMAERTILTDYEDPSLISMLAALHRDQPFDAVFSLAERALLPAATIASELGVAGLDPEVVQRTRDKFLMRQWMRDRGVSNVNSAVVSSEGEICSFAAKHGYPVIVKPRHGAGSENVIKFTSRSEVYMPPVVNDDYIVEQYLSGREISIETFSRRGRHEVVAVTDKLTQGDDPNYPFVETGHAVPARLIPSVADQVRRHVEEFLDTMGVVDGCTHTEVRLTTSGPEIIETHTRLGGDLIPNLVRHATGVDMVDQLVEWTLYRTVPETPTPESGGAAIRYFTLPAGRVSDIYGIVRFSELPGVQTLHMPLQPGDMVSRARDSSSRVGYVMCTSNTPEAAIEMCHRVISGITIEIDHEARRTTR